MMGKAMRKVTKKLTVMPGQTTQVPEAPKVLTPKDLFELQLRMQQVQNITHMKLMVEEAYQARLASTLATYGCVGKFDIDMRTGEITPKKETNA